MSVHAIPRTPVFTSRIVGTARLSGHDGAEAYVAGVIRRANMAEPTAFVEFDFAHAFVAFRSTNSIGPGLQRIFAGYCGRQGRRNHQRGRDEEVWLDGHPG